MRTVLLSAGVTLACSTVRAPDPSKCERRGSEVVIEVPLALAPISTWFKRPEDLKSEISVVLDDLLRGEATKAAVETLAACTGASAAAVEQHARLVRGYFHHYGFEWGPHGSADNWQYNFIGPEVRLVYAYDRSQPANLDVSDFGRFPRAGKRPAEVLFVAPVVCREDSGFDPKQIVARDLPRAPVKILLANITTRDIHVRASWIEPEGPEAGTPADKTLLVPGRRQVSTTRYLNGQTDPVWGAGTNGLARPAPLAGDQPWRVTLEARECGRAVVEVRPPLRSR